MAGCLFPAGPGSAIEWAMGTPIPHAQFPAQLLNPGASGQRPRKQNAVEDLLKIVVNYSS